MHFTLLLALAASTALAEQDLFLGFADDSERSPLGKTTCDQRARTPGDKCYFKSPIYQSKPRAQKLFELWSKILPDSSVVEKPADFKWAEFPKFFTQKAQGAFCQRADAPNRKHFQKTTHTQGLVAQVQWIPVANNGYSGVYAEGSETVVMRLSEKNNLYEGASGLTPSVAFKFLIDGRESENIFAMSSFLQSDSWNFFEKPLMNRLITKQDLKEMPANSTNGIIQDTLFKKFVEGSQKPFALGVSNIADKGNSGAEIPFKETVSPYELRFKSPLSGRFSKTRSTNEWYDDIKSKVYMGENLFEVYAYTVASRDGPETEVKIADVRLQTPLYTSRWSDENLYFQHRPVSPDKKFWSENVRRVNEDPQFSKKDPEQIWGFKVPEGVWPTDPAEAEAKYIDQMNTYGCPFAWLLNLN